MNAQISYREPLPIVERTNEMNFSSLARSETYRQMKEKELDLIVIGGGITGAGIALDATMRGMNVALFEMQDFSAGTSSRSTKLVHGGLRYLKQLEVKMVAEVGKERAVVYENGPHVTTPEWMLLPFYEGGTFRSFSTNIGLRVYDFLAGVKKAERRQLLTKEEALRNEPLLKQEGLVGAGYYVEYKTDDARLTMEVLKKAVEKGTMAINYAKVEGFIYEEGSLKGVRVIDQLTQDTYDYYAKSVINATGPWVDTLREKDNSKEGKTLQLTKGVHLVFDQSRFPLQQAVYFDTPDGRMIFAIPREGKTYVGTTDTVYDGDIAHPVMTIEDREYILKAIQFMFPSVEITEDDVESSWAGLRPLIGEEGKSPSEISRKDEIFESSTGLISIAGGKLTGYRKMAEEVVDIIVDRMVKENRSVFYPNNTATLPISGGDVGGSKGFEEFKEKKTEEAVRLGLAEEDAKNIVQRYGSNVDHILDYYEEAKRVESILDPLTEAILQYSINEEATCTPSDFFIRRTGALFFHMEYVQRKKDTVIDRMQEIFQWDEEEKLKHAKELEKHILEAVKPTN